MKQADEQRWPTPEEEQEEMLAFVAAHKIACFSCGQIEPEKWGSTGISKRGPWAICHECIVRNKQKEREKRHATTDYKLRVEAEDRLDEARAEIVKLEAAVQRWRYLFRDTEERFYEHLKNEPTVEPTVIYRDVAVWRDRPIFRDIAEELLLDAIALTHPDRHPDERSEKANEVTRGLLDLLERGRDEARRAT